MLVISFAPVNSREGFLGCMEGENRLCRYTILKNGEFNLHTLSRKGTWFDIIVIKKFKTTLALDKDTKSIFRINSSSRLEKIGRGFAGDKPGRTFRLTPDGKTLYILTRNYKISSFDLMPADQMARAGSVQINKSLLITDYRAVDNKRLLVGTSSFRIYLYRVRKTSESILVSGLDFSIELSPNERLNCLDFNS
jgi:hypothetical protein